MTPRAWAYAFVAVAVMGAFGAAYGKGRADGRDMAQARYDAALIEEQEAALAQTKRIIADVASADQAYQDRLALAKADADRARSDADRLRRAIIASASGDTSGPSGGDAATIRDLFAECVGYVEWLAGQADARTNELTLLQDWARAVKP